MEISFGVVLSSTVTPSSSMGASHRSSDPNDVRLGSICLGEARLELE